MICGLTGSDGALVRLSVDMGRWSVIVNVKFTVNVTDRTRRLRSVMQDPVLVSQDFDLIINQYCLFNKISSFIHSVVIKIENISFHLNVVRSVSFITVLLQLQHNFRFKLFKLLLRRK